MSAHERAILMARFWLALEAGFLVTLSCMYFMIETTDPKMYIELVIKQNGFFFIFKMITHWMSNHEILGFSGFFNRVFQSIINFEVFVASVSRLDGIQHWFWSMDKPAWSLEQIFAPMLGIYQYYWLFHFCVYILMVIFIIALAYCLDPGFRLPHYDLPLLKYEYRFLVNVMQARDNRRQRRLSN